MMQPSMNASAQNQTGPLPKSEAPVRVMIVDDSALMRKLLSQVLTRDPGIEVVDTAMDGQFALDHLARVRPDVVLMDVDMPRLDGLGALDRIVAEYQLPVVMCSARTTAGAAATLDALKRGAVDFIEKPSLAALTSGEATAEISARVRGAVGAKVCATRRLSPPAPTATPAARTEARPQPPKQAEPTPVPRTPAEQIAQMARRVQPHLLAIGTSTGGPPALEQVLAPLPADYPLGIVIVQHMPAGFTSLLAEHLNRSSKISVREAAEGDLVKPGLALIAPGNFHLRVVGTANGYAVRLDDRTPTVSGHRPSVDVFLESVAAATQGRAAAVILTGMGSDGAEGMGKLAAAGGLTLAQTPDSCICHGMPKSTIDRGYARGVVALEEIAAALVACASAAA